MAIKTNKQTGFTLIEVLLALTITFLFATALFSGYRTALTNADRTTWSMQKTEEQQNCISAVEASLRMNLKSGTCSIAGRQYRWNVQSEERHETVRGFDPATLTTAYTGRYIITYRIELKGPADTPPENLEIKMPA